MSEKHILPINDIKPHEESTGCHCKPKVISENGDTIVVHSSFDGREAIEEFNAIVEINDRVQYDLIKIKHPLAFAKLKLTFDDEQFGAWLNPGYNGYLNYWESKNYGELSNRRWFERNLYDFFDSEGYYPLVMCADATNWCYSFTHETGYIYNSPYKYNNRREAEAACFTELFAQLELKLQDELCN